MKFFPVTVSLEILYVGKISLYGSVHRDQNNVKHVKELSIKMWHVNL